jgi:translation initiation factor IF-3
MRRLSVLQINSIRFGRNIAQCCPPVVKLLIIKSFYTNKKNAKKEAKAKTAKVVLKEIRFGPQTDEHDYNFS